MIDFVFTGVSILSVKSYIEKYYQHLGKSPLVEIFGVTSSNSVVNADFAQQMELWQLTDNSNLEFRFEKKMFEEYVKVDSFDVHQSSNYKMKVGDNYEKLKKSVNLQLNVFELDQTIGQELKQ